MSMVREPGPPPVRQTEPVARRGRPPARNEILRAGRLAGADPTDLAERFGTPFYAYGLDVVSRQVESLRRALPPAVDLAYAVKANPSLAVVRHLIGLGLGADVASGGELRHVLRAGVEPDLVVVTGPGKRDEELAAAVEAGVRAVTVESVGELRRLARIAEGLGRRQRVLLRAAVTESARLERVPAGRRRRGREVRDGRAGPADRGGRGGRLALARRRSGCTRSGPRTCSMQRRSRRTSRRPWHRRAPSRHRPASASSWSTRAAASGSRTRRTTSRSTSGSSALASRR